VERIDKRRQMSDDGTLEPLNPEPLNLETRRVV
jgi:hypothetical protein